MNVIFLDRDGVIIKDKGYSFKNEDCELIPDCIEFLKYHSTSFNFIIITNQSGIARGIFSENEYHAFHSHLLNKLEKHGIEILDTFFCPFLKNANIKKYDCDSSLRKPGNGMLEIAIKKYNISRQNSFLIGDRSSDIIAARKSGLAKSFLINSKDIDTELLRNEYKIDSFQQATTIWENENSSS